MGLLLVYYFGYIMCHPYENKHSKTKYFWLQPVGKNKFTLFLELDGKIDTPFTFVWGKQAISLA